MTIRDLAKFLRLRPQTIYRWAQSKKIPGAKFGKEWRFRRSEIQRWVEEYYAAAKAKDGNSASRARRGSSKKGKKGGGVDSN